MKKVTCIIQARTGSTRLPNKVLKKINNKMILEYVIDRIKRCRNIHNIIIATTENKDDDIIQKIAEKNKVLCYRGSQYDVLERYAKASKIVDTDIVVRITSDCPLIDTKLVDETIRFYRENNYDYVVPKGKNGIIRGLDTEVFSKKLLLEIHEKAKDDYCREHVTPYIYRNPEIYSIGRYNVSEELQHSNWRLCVDEENDYTFIKKIISELQNKDDFDIYDIICILNKKPELLQINRTVKQRSGTDFK
ncbi:acylneuraminate cytidylyltransferase [Clostridium tetani]|uniref:Spore coat polysaccharide biosynthesis protein spsF n=1 Tax=Clostridium tetani (strain Massachusetts / E88) TaxID=212717 RepID=Q893U7_CLOTE|nr:glycosyltransferase family protein [Clostridium tetani]AAO36245.1 spore coat polysaccharide biosynthesis protein spsF [Clostridium tetani E88]KGI37795.1 hypothetical protein KY52_09630 [Clostridium tetani]KGI45484.1 hypothetical protein KY54_05125 [Clostridium tetani]KHO31779.1 hypothetical protein OR63_08730 [Clostridium tetani]KIG22065.1 hypothetical protein RS78_01305 [Clostridium tetani]